MRSHEGLQPLQETELERATLAAIAQAPAPYWELLDTLPAGAFVVELDTWEAVAKAIEAEARASVPADWKPASDPKASAQLLADLCCGHSSGSP